MQPNFIQNLIEDIKKRFSSIGQGIQQKAAPIWQQIASPQTYDPRPSLDTAFKKLQSAMVQPIDPNSPAGKVGQFIINLNKKVESTPFIGDIGYKIPHEYGTLAGNQIGSGIKQFQSGQPTNFLGMKVPAPIAAPLKIGLGGLSLTPAAVAGTYAYEGIKGGLESRMGKDNPWASGIALAGSIAVPGGEGSDIARAQKLINKTAPKIERVGGLNLSRLNLSKKGEEIINAIKPELEKIKGKTLSHAEVVADAQKGNLLEKVISRSETLKNESEMLASRSKLQSLDTIIESKMSKGQNAQGAILDMINESKKVSSVATDWGRKLESLKIDPGEVSTRTKVITELAKLTDDSDELAKIGAKVDWTDSREVTKFYRQFVKPTASDILTEYRYNNMLSGYKTQERNFLGNLTQTAILRPAVKLFSGDFKGAAQYYPGAIKALPEAWDAFKNTMSGKIPIESLDLDRISTGKLPQWYGIPTRMTEAFDRMFSKIIEGGEIAGGKSLTEAKAISQYSLFRTAFDTTNKTGQGPVLSLIDRYLQKIDGLRDLPGGRFVLPFFRTPVQIAKMGIEFSPMGFTTAIGTSGVRQKEQLAKAFIGSGIALVGLKLAEDDRLTWAAPSDAKARELFFASGKKPFSFKVGNTWIPFNYLGPLATPLGLAASWNWYANEAPSAVTDSDLEKAGKTMLGVLRVWGNQTPVENLATFLDVLLKENPDATTGNFFGQMAGSLIPMNGFLRYIAQVTDPIYRKAKGFWGTIESGIPGASTTLPAYTDPSGLPSKREGINTVLPYDVGIDRQGALPYSQMYSERMNTLQGNAMGNQIKTQLEGGNAQSISPQGLQSYLKTDKIIAMPEGNLYQKVLKKEAVYGKVSAVIEDQYLTAEQKDQAFKDLGIQPELGQYYYLAGQSTQAKEALVMQMLENTPPAQRTNALQVLRVEVNGKSVLTSTIINDLEDAGVLSKAQGTALKALTIDESGKMTVKASGGGGSRAKPPVFKAPTMTAPRASRMPSMLKPAPQGYLRLRSSIPSIPKVNLTNIEIPNYQVQRTNPFAGLDISGAKTFTKPWTGR